MTTVVITGFGAFTPVGADTSTTWNSLVSGTSGARTLDYDWIDQIPVTFACETVEDPLSRLDRVKARRMDRSTQHAMIAGREAWLDAGYDPDADNDLDPERVGVSFSSGIGGLQTLLSQWDVQREKGTRRVSPFAIPALMPNAPAANLGLLITARAAVQAPVSACASSNEAIALGIDMIRHGRADVVAAGGTEAVIHPLPINAFAQMQALSRRNDDPAAASRPWDVDRDGFVMGEGAVVLVLESLEHAKARGAKIYGTAAGAGISADSFDIVQPDPSGHGQQTAMEKALRDAGIEASDVKHVNAHGTSTPAGDMTEAKSVRAALGAAADDVVVTSTKSMTGHLLGGAGAIEALATTLALANRVVPPTINLDNPDPDLPIDVAREARALPEGDLAALSNSFGFGGHNVALVVTNENQTVEPASN